jgi:N-ethylmaleimide reductase
MAHDSLFTPLKVGAITVPNRILLAPLTRNRALPDGVPGALAAQYYTQRASGGLLITEATQITAMGKGYVNTPGIHSNEQIAAWKEITGAVHDAGGKIALQLWHVGRISHSSLLPDNAQPVSSSAIRANAQTFNETGLVDTDEPRALDVDEIPGLIADYVQAARNARKAGFDLVEIHAANGYLIDQFLRDGANKRRDSYGGSVFNRVRLLREITEAVAKSIGADRVGVRLSPTGTFNDISDSDPATLFTAAVKSIDTLGLAYLHLVEDFGEPDPNLNNAAVLATVREAWSGVYIGNGDYDAGKAERAVSSGKADAIAFGRSFLANPDLPARIRSDTTLNAADHTTFYGGGAEGYTDYPALLAAE